MSRFNLGSGDLGSGDRTVRANQLSVALRHDVYYSDMIRSAVLRLVRKDHMKREILITIVSILAALIPAVSFAGTVIFLTSGTSWVVPSDWTSGDNSIEVIGGGGGSGGNNGGGGGGGAYSKATNVTLTPGATVTVAVGAAGAGGNPPGSGPGSAGGDTYLCNSTSNCTTLADTAVVAGAQGGAGGSINGGAGGVGGASASGIGSIKYSGGAGHAAAGGGGGAAGMRGAGRGGAASTFGGDGDAGFGGAGGSNAVGGAGTEWDSTHGSGGGGGNAAGGNYGGGGGGAGANNTTFAGTQGLIVISYPAFVPNFPTHPTITLTKSSTVTGQARVGGTLSKGSGTFVIDDPLDPKNKLLYHSFVESPDVLNIYDGIATLDKNGEATIELPAYFLALNKNFQYLATPIGGPMPNLHLSSEVRKRFFGLFGSPVLKIAGGAPNGKISWQVTGIRHDPYILANPIVPEVEKGPSQLVDKGKYLCEECYAK